MHKKKILILIKNLDGGTGTFLKQIVKLKKNFHIYILALESPKYNVIDKKIQIHYFRKNPVVFYRFRLYIFFILLKEILWVTFYLYRYKPKTCIGIDTHCNMLLLVTKFLFPPNSSIITTTHNNLGAVVKRKLDPLLTQFLRFFGYFLYKNASVHVGVSQGVSKYLEKFFHLQKPPITINYGINLSEATEKGSLPLKEDDMRIFKKYIFPIISVGRFEEQKDFSTIIKAFSQVVKKIPTKFCLILIGDGPQRKDLEILTKKLHINEHVYFFRWKQNIYTYLNHVSLFIMSSNYDGLPYVLLEAMSQGVPIISTNTPYGPSELLAKEQLVPIKNPEIMAQAILSFYKNKTKQKVYRQTELEKITLYTEKKMLDRYKQLFTKY